MNPEPPDFEFSWLSIQYGIIIKKPYYFFLNYIPVSPI